MKDDIRYSEFKFLHALANRVQMFEYFYVNNLEQQKFVGLDQLFYMEMAVTLAEDSYIVFEEQNIQLLVKRLRGELSTNIARPITFHDHEWADPRDAIHSKLIGPHSCRVRITYRGLRRLEELRELLKRDRILDHLGVLLDLRYFPKDFEEALRRPSDIAVSVLRLDMDHFKPINDEFCHAAGDVVMKSYLETVRDCLGSIGTGYRGSGDEVVALIVGQGHKRAVEIAESVRAQIEMLKCKFNDTTLPSVTVSIGVASAPPESRGSDLETLADGRQGRAKKEGRNRVISSDLPC